MIKNLSLKQKFIVLLAPIILLTIGLATTSYVLSESIKSDMERALYDELYSATENLINADRDFYQAYVADILATLPDEDAAAQKADKVENYQQTVDNVAEAYAAIEHNDKLAHEFTVDSLNAANKVASESSDFSAMTMEELVNGFNEKVELWNTSTDRKSGEEHFSEARDYLNTMEDLMDAYAVYELRNIDKKVDSQLATVAVVALIVLVLIMLLVVWTVKYILGGIEATKNNLENLANKNISFEPAVVDSKDEIGQMSQASVDLANALQDVIGGIKETVESLTSAVHEVSSLCEQNSDSSVQIDEAVQELARATGQMAGSVENANGQTIEMGTDIENIEGDVRSLMDSSNAIKTANDQATACMNKVEKSSTQTVASVNQISEQIKETNKAIAEINSVVATIMEISTQTNLLALNASIEAARAGEAGKGFAVVADEIGKLAAQSQDGAKQIEDVANKMITMSEESVKLAVQVAGIIDEEQKEIDITTGKFSGLSSEVASSLDKIAAISGRTENLVGIKNVIMENVSDLSAISEENGAMGEEISASVTHMSDAIATTMSKAQEMQAIAETLLGLVEDFK